MYEPDEDTKAFGEGRWVYCSSHMAPHTTGWCTVSPRDKTLLDARDREAAYAECRAKGFDLYGETQS
jgi:hypothetical protein